MMTLLLLLFTKHLIFDFFFQPPYMWQNKGTYGHPGGLMHAGVHSFVTYVILLFFVPTVTAYLFCIIEFLIHYHMDWFKMWYGKKKGYTATTHEEFWWWMGIDQYIHSLTYLGIVWALYV